MIDKYFDSKMIFCSFSTVKLCQDFIAEARDESLLQDTYQIAAYGRRMAPSSRNGKRNKTVLKNLGRY